MNVGDVVLYKDKSVKIIEIRWQLYCIKFIYTGRQIWVNKEALVWN